MNDFSKVSKIFTRFHRKEHDVFQKEVEKSDIVPRSALLWLLFLALHAIIVFGGPSQSSGYNIFLRNWGFDFISYYSLPWILLFYALGIAICIPIVNERFNEILELVMSSKLFQVIDSKKFLKYFIFLLVGIAAIGVFRIFQIKYNFLGDMDIRVQQTIRKEFVSTEALTMYMMHYLYKILNSWLGWTGLKTFQWVSYVSGGVCIIVLLLLTDELVEGQLQKALFFLFSLCLGSMQMFFGYAEVYCLPAVSILIYLYVGILYIKGRVLGALPFLAFFMAVGTHLLSVALLPSFVLLLFYPRIEKWLGKKKKTILDFVILLLAVTPLLYFAAPKLGTNYFLIPFIRPAEGPRLMTMFSIEHLWEFFNSQMLAAGTGFFLFLYVLFISLTKKIKYDATLWFFATGALGMLYLSFLTNAVRGSGDWDILAFPSLVYNVFGTFFLLTKMWKNPAINPRYLLPILIVFNGMSAAAWIGINTSDKSIEKIERMIIGDPANYYQLTLPDLICLGGIYEFNKLEDKAWEITKRAYEHYPNDPRSHYNYASKLLSRGQAEIALPILEKLIKTHPEYPSAYDELIEIYVQRENTANVYRVVTKLFLASRNNPGNFKKIIGKEKLEYVFTWLRDTEKRMGNEQRARIIEEFLSQL